MKAKRVENINKDKPGANCPFTAEDWEEFERGISFFNGGQFQHAFEAWELIWEHSPRTERKFLRGLMDMTSSCQKALLRSDYEGAHDDIIKAKDKLKDPGFLPEFLTVSVEPLIEFFDYSIKIFAQQRMNGSLEAWRKNIPKIYFRKPSNPDLLVELCEITRSELFKSGLKSFNDGYYWEAHEAWEELWREQVGEGKKFTEGFVQFAEAYHFAKGGKFSSAVYVFEKAISSLRCFERIECLVSMSSSIAEAAELLQSIRFSQADQKGPFRLPKKPKISLINQ